MTDDEVNAAVKARLVADGLEPPPTAETTGKPAETKVVDNPYIKLASPPPKEKPGFAEEVYKQLPEGAQPYALGATGYVAGKGLRAALPQAQVFGTPEYRDVEAGKANIKEAFQNAQTNVGDTQSALARAEAQNAQTRRGLEGQLAAAQQQHATGMSDLERARAEHAHAQTLNVDEELARRRPTALTSNTPVELTPQPKGGPGTEKYSLEFGANPTEAKQVASMSTMQKTNIPTQTEAWDKISRIAPGYSPVQESPLILNSEGQKALQEKLTAERNADAAAKIQADVERKQLATALAQHKAEVQARLETAQENARLNQRASSAAAQALAAHSAAPVANPERERHIGATNTLSDLRDRLPANPSGLVKLGLKFAPRFIPGAGAAFAPIEAEAAKKDWEAAQAEEDKMKKMGHYGRAAVHGLGAAGALAQASGVPLAMGIGDIMQVPAAGLAAYDYFTPPR